MMNEVPIGDIYFIPFMLEDCILPEMKVGSTYLNSIQRYNYYKDGINTLVKQIKEHSYGKFNHNSHQEKSTELSKNVRTSRGPLKIFWNGYRNYIQIIALATLLLSALFYTYQMYSNEEKATEHKTLIDTLKEANNYFKVEHFHKALKEYEKATMFVSLNKEDEVNLSKAREIATSNPEMACKYYQKIFSQLNSIKKGESQ